MKFILFFALFAVAVANSVYDRSEPEPAPEPTPVESAPEVVAYAPQSYSFNYNVKDSESENDFVHSEKSDGNVISGSYKVELPDGRTQIVTYRADENGNVVNVKYEGVAHYPGDAEYKAQPKYSN